MQNWNLCNVFEVCFDLQFPTDMIPIITAMHLNFQNIYIIINIY